MNIATDKMTLVTLSASPVFSSSRVLNKMPSDSPALTMHSAFRDTTKNILTVRRRSVAIAVNAENIRQDMISQGSSNKTYAMKNDSIEYAPSSYSYTELQQHVL